jgi:hypothetical protein
MALRIQAHMAPADLQVRGGHRTALLVEGQGDFPQSLPQIIQIGHDRQNGHQFRADRDSEPGPHHEAVIPAADSDDDFAEGLGAKIQDPAELDSRRIHFQPTHARQTRQLLVGIVALVLHSGRQRHHGQIVGVHQVVDVARQSHGELGHRDQQGVPSPRRGALDVHRGTARGLAQATADPFAPLPQSLQQSDGGRGLSFPEWRGSDGGDLDVSAVGPRGEPIHDAQEIQLAEPSHGDRLVALEPQTIAPLLRCGHPRLGGLGDLPVGHLDRVVWHAFPPLRCT